MIKERRKKLARLRAIRRIQRNKRLKVWIKPLLIVGFITVILSSCLWVLHQMGDPLKLITFVNKTKQPATVTIQPSNTNIQFSLTNRTNSRNYSFTQADREQNANTIYLANPLDKQGYMFGVGYLSEAEIGTISQDMGKLTFMTTDKTVIYDKPEQIQNLLKENWEKSGKENTIEIEVK